MNISYNWLKTYLPVELTPQQVADALTSIGLEIGGVEEVTSLPRGLAGLVLGRVLTCVPHENSDHLHVTTVSIGEDEPLQIVCGAPNVKAGKAVVVATLGTVLGKEGEEFTIKKSKIRGVESYGMLCSEVEIGVGEDNSGIILLDPSQVVVGTPASEYFGVERDYILEVDITPNRVDATSHYGVARDLAAYLTQHYFPVHATLPETKPLPQGACPLSISVEDAALVPRFQGVVIRGVKVAPSPEWLCFRLQSIGLKSINNVVDATNYVLHEFGQPLHAYDLDEIGSGGLKVVRAREGVQMLALDGTTYTLTSEDIVIADSAGTPLCLGGIIGGMESGTTPTTKDVFLEAASFHASYVRKSARRHGLSTDSSFRFERGLDPNRTTWALERAAALIQELSPGSYIEGGVYDYYPEPQAPYQVELSLQRMTKLIGKAIPETEVERILSSLEIEITKRDGDVWHLLIPRYRVDVTREVDVIEEVLRIYGYNQVEMTGYIHAALSPESVVDRSYQRRLLVSEQLVGAGFSEILCNSLTSSAYYTGLEALSESSLVRLLNPLSGELDAMRQTLLFGGLLSLSRNLRRQQKRFYYFEWGNCYMLISQSGMPLERYAEQMRLGLWIAGSKISNTWTHPNQQASPYELKGYVEQILQRMGLNLGLLSYETFESDIYSGKALRISSSGGGDIARLGLVSAVQAERFDIDIPVYFAELEWQTIALLAEKHKPIIEDLPRYPVVKRDLSLLIDEKVPFAEIERVAHTTERKLLQRCELFDVYEGKNLPTGKKSYAVSFYMQDKERTMTEGQISKIMDKIHRNLSQQLGASLR